jgi:hypothetical protein
MEEVDGGVAAPEAPFVVEDIYRMAGDVGMELVLLVRARTIKWGARRRRGRAPEHRVAPKGKEWIERHTTTNNTPGESASKSKN